MPVWGAQSARTRAAVSGKGKLALLDDHVVVAERLPLLEAHGAALYPRASRSISAAAPSAVAAGQVDACAPRGRLTQPGELALRVVARSPLHRLHVAAQELLEAERSARGARCACGVGPAHLLDGAGRHHRLHALADPRVQRLALHHEPAQERRVAQPRGPELRVLPGGRGLSPISSSSSARSTRVRSPGSIAAAACASRAASSAWRASLPRAASDGAQALANLAGSAAGAAPGRLSAAWR